MAGLMPAVLHVDTGNHVLVLEDVDSAGDFTSIYSGAAMPADALAALLAWLERLAAIAVSATRRGTFANRAMRALNHEHMFRFPLAADNGLGLDGITPGLRQAVRELAADRDHVGAVEALGRHYLADGYGSAKATMLLPEGAPFLPPPQTMTTYCLPSTV